jgi:hypothetical protein
MCATIARQSNLPTHLMHNILGDIRSDSAPAVAPGGGTSLPLPALRMLKRPRRWESTMKNSQLDKPEDHLPHRSDF